MNKKIWSAACGAILAGAVSGVFAQTPTSEAPQSTSSKNITVTGCVARAQQSPTGTTGTTGATATKSEAKFILTNASLDTSKATGAAGTTGSAAPSSTSIASEYRLDASDAKLSAHVGHKVEISGTVEAPSMSEQKPAASAANSPTLKVDTVKMIASTCSGQ